MSGEILNGSFNNDSHPTSTAETKQGEEVKARVDAMWEQMNCKMPLESIPLRNKSGSKLHRVSKRTSGWMTYLGLDSKKEDPGHSSHILLPESSYDIKRIPAEVSLGVNESAATYSQNEKEEEWGEEMRRREEVGGMGRCGGVDAVLEQIKKKPKVSVMEKTKRDWGEFKEDNQTVDEELEAYKKSSGQYLDKLSFLHRADYREFERERDVRLAIQARRTRPD